MTKKEKMLCLTINEYQVYLENRHSKGKIDTHNFYVENLLKNGLLKQNYQISEEIKPLQF